MTKELLLSEQLLEMVDEYIHKSPIGLEITKEADSDEFEYACSVAGGPTLEYYVILQAALCSFERLLDQMGELISEKKMNALADGMAELLRSGLNEEIERYKERKGVKD